MTTIITDVLFNSKSGGSFTIVDGKYSGKNDLVNASDEKIFEALTPNQKLAYTWIENGQVGQVIPRGGNAIKGMNLSVNAPIKVSPVIQIAVNTPVNSGVYLPGGVVYRNFQVPQPPPAAAAPKK